MKKIIIVTLFMFIVPQVFGQFVTETQATKSTFNSGFGVNPVKSPFSLIDVSKIKWSHSYSISFFSGGNSSGSAGLLQSTLLYDISSKLSLALNLGLAHEAGAIWGNGSSNATFLPGFQIDFHPTNNFNIRVNYQELDGNYFLMNKYRNRHWLTEP